MGFEPISSSPKVRPHRPPTPTTTYIVRTPTGQTALRPIILSNQVRPTLSQPSVTPQTPQPQQVMQRQVQVPIRFPDGRMQVLQIPLSAIAGNQPIQIAINTQPTVTTANVLPNSIQIVSSANGTQTAIVSNPQPVQTPQIRIITNNTPTTGQPMVAKLVQMRPQQPTVQTIQAQPQQIQIQGPQLNQILAQQLQAGKIQLKINTTNVSPSVATIQTPQRPTLPQQQQQPSQQTVKTQTPIVATVRIEPKVQQQLTPLQSQPKVPETPNNTTLKVKSPINQVVSNDKTSPTQTSSQTPLTTTQTQTPQQFVLTSEMTQEIVRQALMNPNVAPGIQQKLIALQKHHQEQKDPIKSKAVTTPVTSAVVNTKSKSPSGSRSGSKQSKAKAKQTQVSNEQKEETSVFSVCQAVVKSMLDKLEKDEKNLLKKQKAKESVEERRHRQNSSKLQVLLFKHTEVLKKDIAKRRALLEKNLKMEVMNELSALITKQNSPIKSPKSATVAHAVNTSPKKANVSLKRKLNNSDNNLVIDEDFDDSDEIRPPKQKKSRHNSSASSTSPKKSRSPACNQSKGMKNMKANALYCICRKPYDASRFMVGCDVCSNWFHVDCVGLTEIQAKKAKQYMCPNCDKLRAKNNELYCLCHQPYDESQFYICCDRCQDWFHGRCVGVLQSEADSIDEYVCPNCQSDSQINFANLKQLDSKDIENLRKLLKSIQV